MNIKVLYFARIKEVVNYSTEEMVFDESIDSVRKLKEVLASRGGLWTNLFDGKQLVRAAINHTLVDDGASIQCGDEVAFFPPVTGG